jgi:phosphate transport system permease protein
MPASAGPESPNLTSSNSSHRLFSLLAWPDLGDRLFKAVCLLAALSVIVLLGLLIVFLVVQSVPALDAFGLSFFTSTDWDPRQDHYGALVFIFGTLVTSAIAMLVAVPLGIGAAAFLAEIAPAWLRRGGSFLLELLAAIPSVVYGFWGIFFLAPYVQDLSNLVGGPNTGGANVLSAGLILAIMVLPYVTAITYDVCRAVPRSQREASLALGATRWQTIWNVVLPYARPGIIAACFLALGRALGETMAVTMLIGNNWQISPSPFDPGDSIASIIANQLGNTNKELHISALVALGLVLLLVTIIVNSLARVLLWRMTQPRRAGVRLPRRLRSALEQMTSGQPQPRLTELESASAAGDSPGWWPRFKAAVKRSFPHWMDRFMTLVMGACVAITVGFLFLIAGYILGRGVSALTPEFFTNLPIDEPPGLGHAVVGTAMLVALATLWAVPLGILGAVYLAEYRTSFVVPFIRFVGELLGGVPSIILGVFGYALLVIPFGFSGWAGAFALGVMMIPIVLRATEESLKLVPSSLRNASYALGASTWKTITRVVIPAALPAIVTGVFLALARIAGETAPLLLTAYNSNFWPRSPSARTPFLTYYIFTYARSDDPGERELAWAATVVLLALVIVLSVGIRLLTGKRTVLASQAD